MDIGDGSRRRGARAGPRRKGAAGCRAPERDRVFLGPISGILSTWHRAPDHVHNEAERRRHHPPLVGDPRVPHAPAASSSSWRISYDAKAGALDHRLFLRLSEGTHRGPQAE